MENGICRVCADQLSTGKYRKNSTFLNAVCQLCGKNDECTSAYNFDWRSAWTWQPVSRTALHKSGIVFTVTPSPNGREEEGVSYENIQKIDWKTSIIIDQGFRLWLEEKF